MMGTWCPVVRQRAWLAPNTSQSPDGDATGVGWGGGRPGLFGWELKVPREWGEGRATVHLQQPVSPPPPPPPGENEERRAGLGTKTLGKAPRPSRRVPEGHGEGSHSVTLQQEDVTLASIHTCTRCRSTHTHAKLQRTAIQSQQGLEHPLTSPDKPSRQNPASRKDGPDTFRAFSPKAAEQTVLSRAEGTVPRTDPMATQTKSPPVQEIEILRSMLAGHDGRKSAAMEMLTATEHGREGGGRSRCRCRPRQVPTRVRF